MKRMRTKLSLKFFMREADDVAGRNDNILNIFDKSRWLYRVIANVFLRLSVLCD